LDRDRIEGSDPGYAVAAGRRRLLRRTIVKAQPRTRAEAEFRTEDEQNGPADHDLPIQLAT
jgi:hypothetical protein